MFKEGRRGLSDYRPGCNAGRRGALVGAWLFLLFAQLAAEEAADPEEPAEVAVATDMDEPARFVPHEEQAIGPDVGFAADNPLKGDGITPRADSIQPSPSGGVPTPADA